MKKNYLVSLCMLAAGLILMAQSPSCTAPMDATGEYSGIWSFDVKDNGTVIDTIECPLSMTLEQNVALRNPANYSVNGTIHVDFSCFEESPDWPEWAEIPEPTDIRVGGTMENNGKILLLSGGCRGGACIVYIMPGQGETGEENTETVSTAVPDMDRFYGDWGIGIGIAFLGQAGVGGAFDVTRVE